ncbi:efflux transporter outer membrane subunit [Telluria mixta]|uniref:Efflux transporter outer membrane subunit n=1 Tax=Telluria mixta TaxID=34071 RepID=A0ABT2C0I6_9BURK|nr:efflux transporter outer membrane subunit [Telluria mixta]MCS0630846.1 efflux transporter outer membrane subunit [Telluria mixta]WEM98846.1 efflux transporter outer membrane subunit [Telluria mixta]
MKTVYIKSAVALAVAALLSACGTVGKDFVAPQGIDTPAFRHAAAEPSDQAARLPAAWWTVFGDKELDQLEQRALRDNPNVRAAAQRLVQAQAQLGVTRASQLPTVGVSAGVANSRTSAETPMGVTFGGRSIKGNEFSVGANFSYELDLWGRVRRAVEAADAQALAAQDDRDGVMLMLSGQVATTYWQLRGLDADIAILNDALATRRESQQLIEARFNAGLSNELDVSRTRIERANAEADIQEAQRQRNTLEHALAVLVGASPSQAIVAPAAGTALPQPPAIPVGLPASLLGQRPDLAASVATLKAFNAQVGVAEGAYYPSLSLTGNFGYASETLSNLTKGSARQFSFGPLALSLPIFEGGRIEANVKLAKARYDEAVANHEGRLLTALREVEDALSDVQQRQKQGDVQVQAQQAAARAVQVAQARFDRGVSTYLDVTDAQRSALAADRAAAQIRTQRLLAAVSVARALGGGWQQGKAEATVAAR